MKNDILSVKVTFITCRFVCLKLVRDWLSKCRSFLLGLKTAKQEMNPPPPPKKKT